MCLRGLRQVRHKPACGVTEASWSLEISDIETRGIILRRQRTTADVQADLHLCCSHRHKTGFLMTWLNSEAMGQPDRKLFSGL